MAVTGTHPPPSAAGQQPATTAAPPAGAPGAPPAAQPVPAGPIPAAVLPPIPAAAAAAAAAATSASAAPAAHPSPSRAAHPVPAPAPAQAQAPVHPQQEYAYPPPMPTSAPVAPPFSSTNGYGYAHHPSAAASAPQSYAPPMPHPSYGQPAHYHPAYRQPPYQQQHPAQAYMPYQPPGTIPHPPPPHAAMYAHEPPRGSAYAPPAPPPQQQQQIVAQPAASVPPQQQQQQQPFTHPALDPVRQYHLQNTQLYYPTGDPVPRSAGNSLEQLVAAADSNGAMEPPYKPAGGYNHPHHEPHFEPHFEPLHPEQPLVAKPPPPAKAVAAKNAADATSKAAGGGDGGGASAAASKAEPQSAKPRPPPKGSQASLKRALVPDDAGVVWRKRQACEATPQPNLRPSQLQRALQTFLANKLTGVVYEAAGCSVLARKLSSNLVSEIHRLGFTKSHKMVCVMYIVPLPQGGMAAFGNACQWEIEKDMRLRLTHVNETLMAVADIFIVDNCPSAGQAE